MDRIMFDLNRKKTLYMQLYQHFKAEIEQNSLADGEKLPSIRGLAKTLSVSKITVEKAYQQLVSEGYIQNNNRSRYIVNNLEAVIFKPGLSGAASSFGNAKDTETGQIVYDFASGEMDMEGFDFSLWKRCLSRAFSHKERLVGYGNRKGEEELRAEIAKYIQRSRGVHAHKEQIIVGAGVQSLLHTVCSLLKRENASIAFEEPGFKSGRHIFADHGFQIIPIRMKKDGVDVDALAGSGARLVYLSPSHQFPTGNIMPIGKRNRLLRWAQEVNGLIIEDDYDSEFRYFGRPIPALKGIDSGGYVIYLGSFSKVILPSIRISYMVLPDKLLQDYERNASIYKQTVSTLEQLALAGFMADGHLERQIRRLRKLYYKKSQLFFDAIKDSLGKHVEVNETESGIHTILSVNTELKAKDLVERALEKGCRVASVEDCYWETSKERRPQVLLYFSKIPAGEMKQALELLRQAWFAESQSDRSFSLSEPAVTSP